jgi:hypothetical protein
MKKAGAGVLTASGDFNEPPGLQASRDRGATTRRLVDKSAPTRTKLSRVPWKPAFGWVQRRAGKGPYRVCGGAAPLPSALLCGRQKGPGLSMTTGVKTLAHTWRGAGPKLLTALSCGGPSNHLRQPQYPDQRYCGRQNKIKKRRVTHPARKKRGPNTLIQGVLSNSSGSDGIKQALGSVKQKPVSKPPLTLQHRLGRPGTGKHELLATSKVTFRNICRARKGKSTSFLVDFPDAAGRLF